MAARVYKPNQQAKAAKTRSSYTRFDVFQRIEHFILILSFTTLAVTGLPQKYALNAVSQFVISLFGGIESTRVIHRIAAAIFLLQSVYHIVVAIYKIYVKNRPADMVPGVKDGVDAYQWITYNLGLGKTRPKMPRYNFMEKAEYWAMLWGLILMGVTGLMLWNPIATTNFLPGQFIPAAKAAHGAEAVLAVLAIILWHFYHVHIKQFNKSMFTGEISHHEMVEEHGAELEAIQAGAVRPLPAPMTMRKRMAIFVPVAAVFSLVMVGLTFFFLTFEDTAIETIPPISDVPVVLRATPTIAPTAAAAAPTTGGDTGELTWNGGIGAMMAQTCAGCHGSMGGFSVETYESMMEGVEPGDPDSSPVVAVQAAGHPATLSDDDLSRLIEWIEAGAPEGEAAAAPEEEAGEEEPTEEPEAAAGPASENSWDGSISALFEAKCISCHGSAGDFSAESYDEVMEGVIPGDPDNSDVIIAQLGRHPEVFDNAEFDAVYEWIAAGAPER